MSDVERATSMFAAGFSCSQSVLGAYAEQHGLPRELALGLADAFGGGLGGLGRTCGAVTGAIMVIGLARGRRVADDTWEADEVFPLDGGFALRWRATIPVGAAVVHETGLDLVLVAGGRITRNEVYFDRAALLEAMRERA
jgi:hypothetical protein